MRADRLELSLTLALSLSLFLFIQDDMSRWRSEVDVDRLLIETPTGQIISKNAKNKQLVKKLKTATSKRVKVINQLVAGIGKSGAVDMAKEVTPFVTATPSGSSKFLNEERLVNDVLDVLELEQDDHTLEECSSVLADTQGMAAEGAALLCCVDVPPNPTHSK